jgi:hypothetical protein
MRTMRERGDACGFVVAPRFRATPRTRTTTTMLVTYQSGFRKCCRGATPSDYHAACSGQPQIWLIATPGSSELIRRGLRGATKDMSRCAYFASAPTVRFLLAVQQLRLLPAMQRRKIAAAVFAEISALFGSREIDELRRAARRAQDERWRLIYRNETRSPSLVMAEQWMLARIALAGGVSPVEEILAQKRCSAVETFISDNLSVESFAGIRVYPPAPVRQPDQSAVAQAAA